MKKKLRKKLKNKNNNSVFKSVSFPKLICGSFCLWDAYTRSSDDFYPMKAGAVSRLDEPLLFWGNILFMFTAGVCFIYSGFVKDYLANK
ncbi:hypothetical protein I6F65_10040 [Pseudoalteromonas sp. SWXJZ94C]|uniref:hypothetical protein n=1 Tax=Pseudoalteromonas sp. SWXJZ94C TaxID=2792065 RepID=UPI0018CFA60F|nr:hypothetical protein [Pseudoalteromonas sp. SWXJZ94C]MBH0057304.1 hypothetical protein [Pseudoalteromonas sp. SWXJZ94C]